MAYLFRYMIRIPSETIQTRRECIELFKVLKEKERVGLGEFEF